ncbi:hypothetical protein [Methanosarcina sp. 2.H.A.1B.4]|uniref:hypothetical protein n=1 Tax=Methanosarcina sp. 2.H.A.1B.4 TaxID=1483600 RepID=UPI0006229027|nr:hypothetical protein [Methanosarcina sp. 2.H.A.1B.4]KKG08748.1 hypothetical protein EO92_13030 [Methanosarcina sp. 2.H.A.1B.4]
MEKLEEIIDVLDQMKSIIRFVHLGDIPEDDLKIDFWAELDLASADVYGILTRYRDVKSSKKVKKEEIDFLVSERLKNLKDLSAKINLEDYPHMEINFLVISHTIKLLETYYKLIDENNMD